MKLTKVQNHAKNDPLHLTPMQRKVFDKMDKDGFRAGPSKLSNGSMTASQADRHLRALNRKGLVEVVGKERKTKANIYKKV